MVRLYHQLCDEVRYQDQLLSSPMPTCDPLIFGPLAATSTAELPSGVASALVAALGHLTRFRALARKAHEVEMAAWRGARQTRATEGDNPRTNRHTGVFQEAEALRRSLLLLFTTFEASSFTEIDESNIEQLAYQIEKLRGIILRRQQVLIAALAYSSEYVRRLIGINIHRFGYLTEEDVKGALKLARKRTSAQAVRECGERLLFLLHQPLSTVFMWKRGVVCVDYDCEDMKSLLAEYGPPVVDLLVLKRQELDEHCPSGSYHTEVLWRTKENRKAQVSEVISLCVDRVDQLFGKIANNL